MSDTTFTPGPWWVNRIASTHIESAHRDIASVLFTTNTKDFTRENQANARLIAAAPEMYALLERAVNIINRCGIVSPMPYDWGVLRAKINEVQP